MAKSCSCLSCVDLSLSALVTTTTLNARCRPYSGSEKNFPFGKEHPMKEICFGISLALTLLTQTGVVTARPSAAQGTLLWQQSLSGTTNDCCDEALSVAVDNQGNVVAAGFTLNSATFGDFTVAKFDGHG